MKKLMMVVLTVSIPMVGFAKVSDFNSMISDNMKAQTQLHHTVKDNIDSTRLAIKEEAIGSNKVVETGTASYNSPTSKGALTFEKEKYHPKKADRAQFDRLATEINESEF